MIIIWSDALLVGENKWRNSKMQIDLDKQQVALAKILIIDTKILIFQKLSSIKLLNKKILLMLKINLRILEITMKSSKLC